MCKVSVLLPVYNVEDYVEDTIYSVLNQTFFDFELIIIDDSSTDNTRTVVEKYSSKDSRIKLLTNEKNLGISKTLNYGLSISKGQYIARIDGDDLMDEERLQRQVEFLEKNLDHALIGCWVKNIDEKGVLINKCKYPTTHNDVMNCVSICSPVLHIWMARASLYNELGGYRNTNPAEDYDFLLRTLDLGYKIANLPYYGAIIRLRSGNTMSVSALKQKKAFNYLRRLYLVGRINKVKDIDFYAEGELPTSKCMLMIHDLSIFFLRKSLASQYLYKRIIFAFFALVSPYTIQDIYRRQRFKRIINKLNTKRVK